MGKQRRWPTALVVLACLTIVAADIVFLCPMSLLHAKWPGCAEDERPLRIFVAACADDGTIAASMRVTGKVQIYANDADNRFRPVSHGVYDADPAWDPSSTRIAYVSLEPGKGTSLRVADIKRGTDTTILRRPIVSQPQWTPDGKHLFFLAPASENGTSVCSVDLGSRKVTEIARTPHTRPQTWEPLGDGRTLAYIKEESIRLLTLGGTSRDLRLPCKHPRIVTPSPDGKFLFVADQQNIEGKTGLLVDLRTGRVETVTKEFIRSAFWSPDGRKLAIANRSFTEVFEFDASSRTNSRMHSVANIQGLGVCWRSDDHMIVLRPDVLQPQRIEEVDVATGESALLYPDTAGK